MSRSRIALLVLVLVTGAPAAPAPAADAVVGDGTPGSCTEAALDAALATANAGGGTVGFACGPSPVTVSLTSAKSISTAVTVDGDDRITLSGGGVTRHFAVESGATATLRELRLVDGFAAGGGALAVQSATLGLHGVTLEGNVSSGDGGAVTATGSFVLVRGSRLAGNESAGAGGAIRQSGGTLDVAATLVHANRAGTDGGALSVTGLGQLAIFLVSLDDNVAAGNGGALDAHGTSGFVEQSMLVTNEAGGVGGAVHLAGSAVSFEQDTLGRNVAAEGGGIYVAGGSSSVQGQVTYSENEATADGARGGGVVNLGTMRLENATLSGNSAAGSGGGLHNEGATTLRFVTIAGNAAGAGGGIWSSGPTLHVRNAILAGDTAAASGDECLVSGGFDVAASLWSGTSCGDDDADGNLPATDALLGPLAFSCPAFATERTRTHDLDPASPARDAGIPLEGGKAFLDQRGLSRPQGAAPDIGAVEHVAAGCPGLFDDDFEYGNTFAWSGRVR